MEVGLQIELLTRDRDNLRLQLDAEIANKLDYTGDLQKAEHERDELRTRAETAEAKCAEMRKQIGAIKHAVEHSQPIPWMEMCKQMEHALSTDCGKPLLDRVKRLEEALKTISRYGHSYSMDIAKQALETGDAE